MALSTFAVVMLALGVARTHALDIPAWNDGTCSEATMPSEYASSGRGYIVCVPNSVTASSSVPFLFGYHGATPDTEAAPSEDANVLQMSTDSIYANTECEHITVYPQGSLGTGDFDTVAGWNSGFYGDWAYGAASFDGTTWTNVDDPEDMPDDVQFFKDMVAYIPVSEGVTASTIGVYGVSNGAWMTQRLVCESGDLIDFAAPHSGMLMGPDGTNKDDFSCAPSDTTILMINGALDIDTRVDGCITDSTYPGSPVLCPSEYPLMSTEDNFDFYKDEFNCQGLETTTLTTNWFDSSTYIVQAFAVVAGHETTFVPDISESGCVVCTQAVDCDSGITVESCIHSKLTHYPAWSYTGWPYCGSTSVALIIIIVLVFLVICAVSSFFTWRRAKAKGPEAWCYNLCELVEKIIKKFICCCLNTTKRAAVTTGEMAGEILKTSEDEEEVGLA